MSFFLGIPPSEYTVMSLRKKESYIIYDCCVSEGQGLQQSAKPPSRDETRSVNPLDHEEVQTNRLLNIKDGANTGPTLTKAG